MSTKVTLIRGDGIGPEVVDAAVQAVEATGAQIEWEPQLAGAGAIPLAGAPLPEATVASIRANRLCLKGPLATPIGGGYRSVNVALRQEFDLYANLRPARTYAGLANRYEKVDLVVVRENTQGEYSGIEHYIDPTRSAAEAISIITRHGSDRIIRFAFEHARAAGRKQVTLVHKANILKMTSGLFLDTGADIARGYPDIQFNDIIVDNCAMQLVRDPTASTSSSRPTCSATSCRTSPPAWSAAWAWSPAATSARTPPSSRRCTARARHRRPGRRQPHRRHARRGDDARPHRAARAGSAAGGGHQEGDRRRQGSHARPEGDGQHPQLHGARGEDDRRR
jgi:hypothetical protein